jgi:hypothetical protein
MRDAGVDHDESDVIFESCNRTWTPDQVRGGGAIPANRTKILEIAVTRPIDGGTADGTRRRGSPFREEHPPVNSQRRGLYWNAKIFSSPPGGVM